MLILFNEYEVLGSDDSLKQKVLKTISENNMINSGDKILVALSGGPDSLTLLHILYSLKDQLNINIGAAHVNHLLRGNDAFKDENLCKTYCENLGLDFYLKRIDINEESKIKGISHEMAGREARYNFFEELSNKYGYNKIAIAHNLNDQAETILMRIMRGTGIEGLVGIKAVRDKKFIRPLIEISRAEIEHYCEENNLKAAIDETNFENIYSRNKIRLELIPYMEKNFNKDVIETLSRMSKLIKEDNEFIEDFALKIFEKYCYKKEDRVIINKEVLLQHKAIVSRVIRMALAEIKGNLYNIDNSHINDIIKLYNHNTGKFIMLPNDIMVENVYKDLHIYIKIQENERDFYEPLEINNKVISNLLKYSIELKTLNKDKNFVMKKNNMIKYFDYDKVKGDIYLRYRKDGDRFTPLGMKGSKKIKDLFMDLKVPRYERDRIPLLCFGNEIAWIVGYKVSDKFKIDCNTKRVLQVTIER